MILNWDEKTILNESNDDLANRLEKISESGETPGRVVILKEAAKRLRKKDK